MTPATPAAIRQIHFRDGVLCTTDRSANCQPPTSNTNQSREPGSLFRTISQWAGCPLSLLMAHLAPVRRRCHVHSGSMSLRGADMERRERGGQLNIGSVRNNSPSHTSVACTCVCLSVPCQVEMTRYGGEKYILQPLSNMSVRYDEASQPSRLC